MVYAMSDRAITGWTWLLAFLLLGMVVGAIWFVIEAKGHTRTIDDIDDRMDELERRVDKIQGGISTPDTFSPLLPTDTVQFIEKMRDSLVEEAQTDPEITIVVPPATAQVPVVTTLRPPNQLDRPTAAQQGGPGTRPDFEGVKPPLDVNSYGKHAAR